MFFAAGLVANEGVNFILKHLIQEPRPINGLYLQEPLHHHYVIVFLRSNQPTAVVWKVRNAIKPRPVYGMVCSLLFSLCVHQVSHSSCYNLKNRDFSVIFAQGDAVCGSVGLRVEDTMYWSCSSCLCPLLCQQVNLLLLVLSEIAEFSSVFAAITQTQYVVFRRKNNYHFPSFLGNFHLSNYHFPKQCFGYGHCKQMMIDFVCTTWQLLLGEAPANADSLSLSLSVCCRIYLGYHTMAQVLYGVLLGAGVALLWFTLVQVCLCFVVFVVCTTNFSSPPQVFCEPYFSQIYQWSVDLLY